MSLITFEQVRYKKVLHDLSFSVPHAGIIGLIGANGSGKSTLLHLTAGLIRPAQGRIYMNGEQVGRQTREKVAFSPEREWLYPFFSVRQSLQLAAQLYSDFQLEKAKALTSRFNLDADKEVRHLSKGNRARLQAILTLSRAAPLLIMDEPLSGLDPVTREHLLDMMAEHTELEKQSIIVSTHEVAEIELYLDHLLFMQDGRMLVSANVEDLRETRGMSVLDVMREALL
ncbi:ATP-binding cassette domain-containing protein [Paenibacillus tarimensis]|uniref:ATP-binding cassette domain-containing protein n=1 Tax=Paenibacillus tarimensis TaxID=416012 RepID=UPI001F1EC3FE|nr:ABC transporter ATP-binding protein [Paenibacillus tarimensis]MCF2945322.1 ABC transporter ATP-binding protein [Paenibacillus tarimensis]